MSRRGDDAKQERRVLTFFVVLAAIIVLTLAYGFYTGELEFHMGKGCGEEDCQPAQ